MPDVDLNLLVQLKPEDASKYFERKGYRFSWDWHDTWQEAHARAFTVAKAMKLDILNDIRGLVQKSIDEGLTFEQFKTRLTPDLISKGWWGRRPADEVPSDQPTERGDHEVQLGSVRRLATIYKTNLQTAYMAGKFKRQIDNADDRPYWQFFATLDANTRASHAALHGKVFRFDDPFWDTHYPPLDWGCRCTVHALDADELKHEGLTVETQDSAEQLAEDTPAGAGWAYNPGKAAWQPTLEKYDYEIARQYVEGAITGPDFERFFEGKVKGNYPVAVLDKAYRERIGAKSQTVMLSDETLSKNKERHPEIGVPEFQKLQTIVEQAQVVILKNNQVFVFIKTGDDYFFSVIKTTLDKKELFVTSLRHTNIDDINAEKKRGIVIRDELK